MGGVVKELLPIGTRLAADRQSRTTVPVLSHAFECGSKAGVDRAAVIISAEKAAPIMNAVASLDLPFPVSYVHQAEQSGLGGAVACAGEEISTEDAATLLLMPDTIVLPVDAPAGALAAVEDGALVAVTLHRPEEPERFGVAELDHDGNVIGFVDKPETAPNPWVWTSIAFAGAFLVFLEGSRPVQGEWGLTEALALAASEGLVQPLFVEDGAYHDVGTYDGYLAALADLGQMRTASRASIFRERAL
jgi:glucose-1-phosphate thymidylyltransferase